MKTAAILAVFAVAASSLAQSLPPPGVRGVDLTGNYIMNDVFCFSTSLGTPTVSASASGYSEEIRITGNTFTLTRDNGTCTASTNGRITFGNTGIATFSGSQFSVPSGSCTFTLTLTPSPPETITPKVITETRTNGETFPGIPRAFVRTTEGDLGLLLNLTVTGSPQDSCYLLYLKQ